MADAAKVIITEDDTVITMSREPEQVVQQKALAIPEQAKAIKVVDKETMAQADNMQKVIADMKKEIDAVFKPMAEKAFAAHRAITSKWNEIKAPLEEADKTLKGEVKAYLRAEQERAEAEQRRLAEIARKEEEDRRRIEAERLAAERRAEEERRIAEAEAAQKAGDEARAAQIIEEAAQAAEEAQEQEKAIIEEPIYVAPVRVAQNITKVDQRKYRTIWKARVIDKAAFLIFVADMLKKSAEMKKLGRHAEAQVYAEYADALEVKEGWINRKAAAQEKNLAMPGLQAFES